MCTDHYSRLPRVGAWLYRPSYGGVQGEALPLPGSEPAKETKGIAKRLSERGQAPSHDLDEARPQLAQLGWYTVPT